MSAKSKSIGILGFIILFSLLPILADADNCGELCEKKVQNALEKARETIIIIENEFEKIIAPLKSKKNKTVGEVVNYVSLSITLDQFKINLTPRKLEKPQSSCQDDLLSLREILKNTEEMKNDQELIKISPKGHEKLLELRNEIENVIKECDKKEFDK